MKPESVPSGPWTGFFNDRAGGERHRVNLVVTFVGEIVSGQGEDRGGVFGLAGRYDLKSEEILCTKTYYGGAILQCRAFFEGEGIWGTWSGAGGETGGFQLWPAISAPREFARKDRTTAYAARVRLRAER
jgi:hypothetical protein